MTQLSIQRLIALPYLILGGWCLLAPHSVERLVFTPAYLHLSATSALMMSCFGAQAVLGSLFIWFSRWERRTFLIYALALLPFFWFNYWFVFEVPMFNRWMMLDFGSNAAMLGLSVWGWMRGAFKCAVTVIQDNGHYTDSCLTRAAPVILAPCKASASASDT